MKKLLPTNEIQYDYHHKGNGIFDDCNGEYKFFEFVKPLFRLVVPLFQHYLFLLIYANTTKIANIMMTIICIGMPNKWENYFICVMPVIVIMMPRIIQVIAILSLRDLMIPAIPIPNMSTPTTIGNFILKFNNKYKLLSQNIYQSVYSQ